MGEIPPPSTAPCSIQCKDECQSGRTNQELRLVGISVDSAIHAPYRGIHRSPGGSDNS